MSGNGQTTVNGTRPTYNSRRESAAVAPRKRFEYIAHFFLIVLACAIWLIASDMVSIERQLQSNAIVHLKLDPELENVWRITGKDSLEIGLKVKGPTHEINQFESSLNENPDILSYAYDIGLDDIKSLSEGGKEQVTLSLDLRRMRLSSEGTGPSELVVQPIIGEKKYTVTLERYITRKARVSLMDGISGEVSGYSFVAILQREFEVEVFGPAGRVNAVKDEANTPVLHVNADIKQILETQARLEATDIEDILKQGHMLISLPLMPIEGITVRKTGGEDEIAQVNVQISFTELQNYVPVTRSFPVDIIMPNWLIRKGARISNLPESFTVELLLLVTQRIDFNDKFVQVVIDLSDVTEEGQKIEGPEDGGPGRRNITVSNVYFALVIDSSRLTYKFENPELTADRYLPTEVKLDWTE